MKIVLVNVLLFKYKKGLILPKRKKMDPAYQISYSPPIGLLYIGGSIEEEGHSVEIIDFYFEKNPIETLYKSLNSADAIGLNVYTPTYKDTAYIAKIIKESNPDLPIIIGGPHCTLQLDRSLLNIPDADIAVIGEGEQIIKDIIKFLEGKKQLSEILGIYYQDNSRKNKAIFYFSLIIFLICL